MRYEVRRKKRRRSPVLIALTSFFAALFLLSGGVLLWELVIRPSINDSNLSEVQDIFLDLSDRETPETGEDAGGGREEEYARRVEAIHELQKTVNPDISGWLRIEGTNINFPVLRSSTDDDEYYLYRDYKGEDSQYGSIFLSGKTPVDGDSQVLYGHSMQDGRMFWSLIDFGKPEVVQKSPIIQYDTELEAGDWKIVSVFKTNTLPSQGEIFDYAVGSFASTVDKMEFYYGFMKRSMVNTGVDLNENDKVLLLSTCSYEYSDFRTVVVARKVREDEERTVDVQNITENENALFPNVWYASGVAPDYWPKRFDEAVAAGKIDWYTGEYYPMP